MNIARTLPLKPQTAFQHPTTPPCPQQQAQPEDTWVFSREDKGILAGAAVGGVAAALGIVGANAGVDAVLIPGMILGASAGAGTAHALYGSEDVPSKLIYGASCMTLSVVALAQGGALGNALTLGLGIAGGAALGYAFSS